MLETRSLGISFGGLKAAQDINLKIKNIEKVIIRRPGYCPWCA